MEAEPRRPSVAIVQADAADLDTGWMEQAFLAMYAHFEECSGRVYLRPDALSLWKRNYAVAKGRSRLVLLAKKNGRPCGFIEGSLRIAPSYFAEEATGYVHHLYVDRPQRRLGVADRLVDELDAWFLSRDLRRVELMVVEGNGAASEFWRKRGFAFDGCQMSAKLQPSTVEMDVG